MVVTTKSALWVQRNAFSKTRKAVCIDVSGARVQEHGACKSVYIETSPVSVRQVSSWYIETLSWKAMQLRTHAEDLCPVTLALFPVAPHAATWRRRIGQSIGSKMMALLAYRALGGA